MRFEYYVDECDPPEVVQAEALQSIAHQLERIADAFEEDDPYV